MTRLILIAVLLAGCDNPLSKVPERIIHQDMNKRVSVIEYQGNEYLIVSNSNGLGICPALPPKAESDPIHQHQEAK